MKPYDGCIFDFTYVCGWRLCICPANALWRGVGSTEQEACKKIPFAAACMGVAFTLVGAFTHPVVLGIGNALFHIGGGVGTIHEDERKGWRGRGMGVFVAPGALGLYLGMQLAKNSAGIGWLYGAGAFMVLACVGMACGAAAYRLRRQNIYQKAVYRLAAYRA